MPPHAPIDPTPARALYHLAPTIFRQMRRMGFGISCRTDNSKGCDPGQSSPPRKIEEAEALLAKLTAAVLRGELRREWYLLRTLCRDFIKAHKNAATPFQDLNGGLISPSNRK